MLATVLQELRTWQLCVHLCVAEPGLGLTNPQQNGGFVPLMNDIFTGSRKRTRSWSPYNEGATQVHKGAWIQNRPLELFPLGLIQDWCHWDALVVAGMPLRGDGLDQLQTAGAQNPMGSWLLWGWSLWTCPKYCHWANFINKTVSSFVILFQWLETRTTLTFWFFGASFFYSVMDACAHKFNKY